MDDPLRESALHFGPGGKLVGILTEPAERRAGAPAVLILNAGIIHRVGPHRLHVRMARKLASLGHPVIRMDQGGVGDSRPIGGSSADGEALASVQAALDHAASLELADSFVLFGLCAGAKYSLGAAAADPRVSGAVLLDPPGLAPTTRHLVSRIAKTAVRPEVWVKMVRGQYGLTERVARRLGSPAPTDAPAESREAGPSPRDGILAMMRTLDDRGAHIFLGVTSAQKASYSYANQIYDLFPEIDLRRMIIPRMYDESDHTFPREADREQLERDVAEWMEGLGR